VIEPTAAKRNLQVAGEPNPYRLEFLADPNLPTIGVYAQAPTTTQAVALADASVRAIADYVQTLQAQQNVSRTARVSIRQIGQAVGSVVDAGITKKLAGLVFVLSFFAWCILVLIGVRVRAGVRRARLPTPRKVPKAQAEPGSHAERELPTLDRQAPPAKQLIGAGSART